MVLFISDRRFKNITSSNCWVNELEKATKSNLLIKFIKASKSEWLATLEEGKEYML